MMRLNLSRAFATVTKFTKSHEYIKADLATKVGVVGITDFAQKALGDVVYVGLPSVGESFNKGKSFGAIESTKAASDLYAPVSGSVTSVNEELNSNPALVNSSPLEKGWLIQLKINNTADLDGLLDEKAYAAHCESEHH